MRPLNCPSRENTSTESWAQVKEPVHGQGMRTFWSPNDGFGSFATGSGEQQVRPCPLCLETGRVFRAWRTATGLCGRAALDVKSSQPVERWHGAASRNLARALSHCCARWSGCIARRGGETKLHDARRVKPCYPLVCLDWLDVFALCL
jgi:hypothetical protein